MIYSYDPILVIFSVIVSIVGAYTCFDLVIKFRSGRQAVNKTSLIMAAFTIGGSIWSMHFIAMLAVRLPVTIRYDLLMTLISSLVSILMTAVALIIVTTAAYSLKRVLIAGVIMGLGISSMHYVGMSAIRGNCNLSYSTEWVLISIAIGMAASSASLWSAMKLHGIWRRAIAALVMGISISGMHYTAMLGTSFIALDKAIQFSQPVLSQFSLGLTTAIVTFIILGGTLLTLVPGGRFTEAEKTALPLPVADDPNHPNNISANQQQAEFHIGRLPVQKNHKTYFVNIPDVVSITSDGHYTRVFTKNHENHFCNHSLSRVEKELKSPVFVRVHRCHIINLDHVESFERQHDKGFVFTRGGGDPIPVSRTNISKLQMALGI